MKKADLEMRRQQLNSIASDSENDFDDIVFSRDPNGTAKITVLPLEKLIEYSDDAFESITGRPQPFKVHSQESLESLSKSIRENGVINPIIVRPLGDGTYQILAGRNRTRASRLCGNKDIPAIIRPDIDDIGAAMIMLDTNLEQRPHLCYSEKAYAYKMRVDLQRRQGKRTDIEGGEKADILRDVGKDNNDSRRTVAYLIRLTYLILPLIDMIDDGRLGFKLGVAISYLSTETQKLLYAEIITGGEKVRQSHIKELKVLEECNAVNAESLRAIFRKPVKPQLSSVTISGDTLKEYADILPDAKEVERLFLEFLKTYRCSVAQPCAPVAQSRA